LRRWLPVILAVLLTSCQTSPVAVVTENPPLPAIDWPVFPDPTGEAEQLPDGRVIVSPEWWFALARYAIHVEANIDLIEEYRRINDKGIQRIPAEAEPTD